jgi:hypothetical protein
VLSAAALMLVAGCDWLFSLDKVPPECRMTSPADSAAVNGVVNIQATATDSVGVDRVEFYVDGGPVATDSFSPYSASWDASGQAEGTWHTLSCIAYDLAQNKGYSDTVSVQIQGIGQTSVYHGELTVQPGHWTSVEFDALAGDTLTGDIQVVTGGALSSFMWLDEVNYDEFRANRAYTAVFERDNFTQMSMSQAVTAPGEFHLVFVNTGSGSVKCWARFVLE